MSGCVPATTAEKRGRILRALDQEDYAYIAVVDREHPYVVPMNFAYDPSADRLYLHTGPGRKSLALETNDLVCIVIAVTAAFRQGPTPCSDSFAFRSLMVEGRTTLLREDAEREAALRLITLKYDPAGADQPFDPDVLAQTLVYAIEPETVSCREMPRESAS